MAWDPHKECDVFVRTNTPESIFRVLAQTVYGNEDTLRQIAMIVYGWTKFINYCDDPHGMNFLLTGVSGSGKTTLCRALRDLLPCPVLLKDATCLSPAGYRGQDAGYLVEDDSYAESCGFAVVFIDEADKKFVHDETADGYSFSEAALNSLLRMVEGCEIKVGDRVVDTTRTLFILSGAFEEVREAKTKRLNAQAQHKSSIGFTAVNSQSPEIRPRNDGSLTLEDIADFYGSGVTQLLGRMLTCLNMEPPTKETLRRIADDAVNEIQQLYCTDFKLSPKEREAVLRAARISGCRSIRSAVWQRYLKK